MLLFEKFLQVLGPLHYEDEAFASVLSSAADFVARVHVVAHIGDEGQVLLPILHFDNLVLVERRLFAHFLAGVLLGPNVAVSI